jgi:hypothetical protein
VNLKARNSAMQQAPQKLMTAQAVAAAMCRRTQLPLAHSQPHTDSRSTALARSLQHPQKLRPSGASLLTPRSRAYNNPTAMPCLAMHPGPSLPTNPPTNLKPHFHSPPPSAADVQADACTWAPCTSRAHSSSDNSHTAQKANLTRCMHRCTFAPRLLASQPRRSKARNQTILVHQPNPCFNHLGIRSYTSHTPQRLAAAVCRT